VTWHLRASSEDGVLLVLDPAERLFNEALEECVPTVAGAGRGVLCTYWVDLVVWRLQNWSDARGVEQQIAEGNTTELVKVDEFVAARSLYEDLRDDALPVGGLLLALQAWQADLVARGATPEPPLGHRQAIMGLPPADS
jgi:hypothetical protein